MKTQLFIEKAIKIHRDRYDYSKVEYVKNSEKVVILCKIHGVFEQSPHSHLSGSGCKKCGYIKNGINFRKTNTDFINKAIKVHGNKYDYSKVEYKNSHTKISILCKEHGQFEQMPYHHLNRCGCYYCGFVDGANKRKYTLSEMISKFKKIHGNVYDYSTINEYINISTNININCKNHGEFIQKPYKHLQGSGCPICINKTEAKLYENLLPLYPSLQTQFKQEWCKKLKFLPFDFCIPEHKIIIELDGIQHFQQVSNWSSPEEQFENDKYKEECANENGYSIIRLLQEDVFNDSYDWVKELCNAIEEIKVSDDIINTYLCKNDEYKQF